MQKIKRIKERKFKKRISLFEATLLGVGSTIGAGIFILLSPSLQIAGPAIIIAFIINAFIAFIIAGNYAEAASFAPVEGGGFSFVEEAYGKQALFLGWMIWLGNTSYAALCAIGIAKYSKYLLPIGINESLIGTIMLYIFTLLNAIGLEKVSKVGSALTMTLVLALSLSAGYLFINAVDGSFTPFLPQGIYSILPATSLLFVCFIGFETITTISAEIKKPKINVPKSLFYSVIIATIVYLSVVVATVYSSSTSRLMNTEIALLEAVRDSKIMQIIVLIGAITAVFSSLNVALMAASRNIYALSRDGFLPKIFSQITPKIETPLGAILLTSAVALILILTHSVEFVASVSNLAYMIMVSSVGFAVLKLRKIESHRGYKMPYHPLGPVLCIILPLVLIPFLNPLSLVVGAVWIVIGIFLHYFTIVSKT